MKISPKTEIGKTMMNDKRYRTAKFAVFSLIFNLIYAFYNGILGLTSDSVWFETACIYYLILCVMRFSALMIERKKDSEKEFIVTKITGAMLMVMSFVMTIIIYIGMSQNIVTKHETVVMITIATYTFTKITFSVIKAVKHKFEESPAVRAIRTVSYAEVAVSLFSMQRSMIVSFGDMPGKDAEFLNMMTGAMVCAFVFILGIIMIRKKESI